MNSPPTIDPTRDNAMKHLAMALIRFYRRFLSRLKPAPTCRFTPTCSAYALEAFGKRGFFVGLALTVWRLLRCSPLSPAGHDPVPLAGFETMPMRWSRYDKYRARHELSDDTDADASACPEDSCGASDDAGASEEDTL